MILLDRLQQTGTYVGVGLIILVVMYYVVTALAYGIARSIMQAARDHREDSVRINKEKQNENDRGTQRTATH